MTDSAREVTNPFGAYLRRLADRPGWSVERIANQAGVHRDTIYSYMGTPRKKVTIERLVLIARGADVDPVEAFMAAASIIEEEPQDRAIGLILLSDLPDDEKERQIARIEADREQQEQKRLADTQELLRIRRAS